MPGVARSPRRLRAAFQLAGRAKMTLVWKPNPLKQINQTTETRMIHITNQLTRFKDYRNQSYSTNQLEIEELETH